MIKEEAIVIRKLITKYLRQAKSVLDIGSSTLEYRTVKQPYIDEIIFKPMRQEGTTIHYLDIINGEGIDIVADISSKSFNLPKEYDLVICGNTLHLCSDIKTSIRNISSTVHRDGYLIITAPLVFPYHDGPLDHCYRFSPNELVALFSCHGFLKIYSCIVHKRISVKEWASLSLRSFIQIFGWRKFSAFLFNLKQCLLLLKSMKVSLVLLRKVPSNTHHAT